MGLVITGIVFVFFLAVVVVCTVLNLGKSPRDAKRTYAVAWVAVLLAIATAVSAGIQDTNRTDREKAEWHQLCLDKGGQKAYDVCLKPGFEEIQIP